MTIDTEHTPDLIAEQGYYAPEDLAGPLGVSTHSVRRLARKVNARTMQLKKKFYYNLEDLLKGATFRAGDGDGAKD